MRSTHRWTLPHRLTGSAFSLLLLFAGTQDLVSAQSLAPALTAPALWTPDHAPFSFRLDGKESAALLPRWTFAATQHRDQTGVLDVYTYQDPASKLQVTAEVRRYPEFPEAVDWVLHVRNDGPSDSGLLEDILPLHWSFAAVPGEVAIRHAKGSDANASDFQPLMEHFGSGVLDRLESAQGLSSSRNTLPFFNLQNGDRGVVGAIGWSGDWRSEFWYAKDGKSISMDAGMKTTNLRLHAGEEIRTPRIVLMAWTGASWMDAQNRWRRLLLAHYTPQDHGLPMRGPVMTGSWGSEAMDQKLTYVRWLHEHAMPIDVYAVDAGWYAGSMGAESDPTNPRWSPWYDNRGDWTASPFYYPSGLEPLGRTLKQDGYGFSLWVEPETAMAASKAVQQHPEWFLKRTPQPGVRYMGWSDTRAELLDLGNAAARKAITATVSELIRDDQVTWFRQDFNIPPLPYWEGHDTPDRVGMSEIRHIEGLYRMWDDLLAAHPGLRIDNCAAGGRRLDIEMLSRSFVIWRTDAGVSDSTVTEAQTTALAPWVPEVMAFETYTMGKPWTKAGPYETPEAVYRMRAGYDAGLGLATPGGVGLENDAWVHYFKQAIAEYREVQPYFFGDFYPLLSYATGPEGWSAWQWDRPETKDGIILLLRRPKSPFPTLVVDAQHLDAEATYEVELRPGYAKGETKRMEGSELTGMRIDLASAPDSLLILYKRVS